MKRFLREVDYIRGFQQGSGCHIGWRIAEIEFAANGGFGGDGGDAEREGEALGPKFLSFRYGCSRGRYFLGFLPVGATQGRYRSGDCGAGRDAYSG